MLELYHFQAEMIDQLRSGLRAGHKRQILAAATGAGKTVVASAMIHAAAAKGNRALFVVDRIELVGQAARHLTGMGLRVGILQGENTCLSPDDEVVVASIQTIRSRGLVPAAFIMIDEAHVLHTAHIKLMNDWNLVPVVGLSATPLREDLGKHFTNLVRGPTIMELIEWGYLARPVVFCPHADDVQKILGDVRVAGGEFVNSSLSKAFNRRELVGDIIRTWQSKAADLKTIVFCVDVAHSKAVCDDFLAAGVTAEQLDYLTGGDDRKAIIDRFRAGQTQVLTSVNILGIGFDVPDVGCAILARPTMSKSLFIQQVGRALRSHPGKEQAIILDHAANTLRHDLPQHFIVPDLRDGTHSTAEKKEKMEKKLSTCKECGAVMEAGKDACPVCGAERPKRASEVHFVDGELVEFGAANSKAKGKGKTEPTTEDKLAWYLSLKGYAQERGRKPGWIYHSFIKKFGHPPATRWSPLPGSAPSHEVIRWAQSQNIAYAKARGKYG